MPLYRTRAVVLRSGYLSDTDKLVTFYTEHHGKIKAVAKGARRIKSRFGAALEPLTHVSLIYFGKEHQELFRVSQCDILSFFQDVRASLASCFPALYFAELVDTLTREGHTDAGLYEFLLASLNALGPLQDANLLCRLFELRLLALLGYKPRLDECVRCRQIPQSAWVGFSYNRQGIFCERCLKEEPAEIRIKTGTLQYLKKLLTLDMRHCDRLKPPREVEEELERLTHRLVLTRLGRELKSYPLLKQLAETG